MEARNASITMFKEFASKGRATKIKDNVFNRALEPLTAHVNTGFKENELDTLVKALVTIPLTLPKFSSLIRVIIPEVSVSDASMESLALWAWENHKTKQTCAILALQWITAVLEHKLAKKASVDGLFEIFWSMMHSSGMERDAAKLVYMLVNPSDVTRWRVNLVLSWHQKNKGQRHTNALLQRFKSFRPELIPEPIAVLSHANAFKPTSVLFASKMAAAAERAEGQGAEPRNETIDWEAGEGRKRRGLGWRHEPFIPATNTLILGSSKRRHKEEASVVQSFKTIESLSCHQLTLALPCQAMSLLNNSAGLHLLAFGNTTLKQRFADTLHPKLIELLREGQKDASYAAPMLARLATLQQETHQGLPVVAYVLANFLPLWNGDSFRDEIWELLERCSFPSEPVLQEQIFPHVRRLFMQADDRERSSIISSLTRLVQAQFESCWRQRLQIRPAFEALPAPLPETLSLVTRFVGAICVDGLTNAKPRTTTMLLDSCLAFYYVVSLLENDSELPVWTVMPAAVFYRAILGRHLHSMQTALKILHRYLTTDRKRLASLGVADEFVPEAARVSRFAADTVNCLWDSKAMSNRAAGLVFQQVDPNAFALARQGNLDDVFAPVNNLAFAPFLNSKQDWEEQVDAILPPLRQVVIAANDLQG